MSETRPFDAEGRSPQGAAPAGEYDEMVSGGGIRPIWRSLVGALQALPEGAVAERTERAARQYRDVAIAYSIGTAPDGGQRPFDLLPMLLAAEEWRAIEGALAQRARLLNLVLADLYGPRRLLEEGRLPPALVFANPSFLRPLSGIAPAGGIHLHAYAADLVRLPDGAWHVLADRLRAPAGIGFAIHNRNILARTVPEFFRTHAVERIEPFFEWWQASLAQLAPGSDRPPRVVVMTPGPFNPAFFEHVYLARHLGAALVEGADLTVRDGHVHIKTLGGLRRVDVILRFMDDDYCDPLELRADSVLGVAGLLQAVRAGSVAVVNALGASLAETPALRPFLPDLAEHLLGERLAMPSVETSWLGAPGALDSFEREAGASVLRPAFAGRRGADEATDRLDRLGLEARLDEARRRPQHYVAERIVPPSTMPVWTPGGMVPRPLALRVFLIHSEGRYVAMPGGLTQIRPDRSGGMAPFLPSGMSKDTWVLASEGPLAAVALPGRPKPAAIRRPVEELKSRTADDLFWLGRYTERLDGAARMMRSAALRLAVDRFGPGQSQEVEHLVRILIEERLLDGGAAELLPDGARLLVTIAAACSGDTVLGQIFRAIERIARALRDRLSNDMWKVIFELMRDARHRLATPPHDVDRIIAGLEGLIGTIAAFAGMASENMTRGSGWRFLDVGRRIERGVYASSVLMELAGEATEGESAFGLALELCDSAITYRSRYLGAVQAGPVLDLVLADESNPRGVGFQLASIAQHLDHFAAAFAGHGKGPERMLAEGMLAAVQNARLEEVDDAGDPQARVRLLSLLGTMRAQLLALSDMLARAYFSHTPALRAVGYG